MRKTTMLKVHPQQHSTRLRILKAEQTVSGGVRSSCVQAHGTRRTNVRNDNKLCVLFLAVAQVAGGARSVVPGTSHRATEATVRHDLRCRLPDLRNVELA